MGEDQACFESEFDRVTLSRDLRALRDRRLGLMFGRNAGLFVERFCMQQWLWGSTSGTQNDRAQCINGSETRGMRLKATTVMIGSNPPLVSLLQTRLHVSNQGVRGRIQ